MQWFQFCSKPVQGLISYSATFYATLLACFHILSLFHVSSFHSVLFKQDEESSHASSSVRLCLVTTVLLAKC